MSDELKRELKSAFLWSNKNKCWVSRAKEPNLWRPKAVAEKLGFTEEKREGERLSYGEQLEKSAERTEARAERYEQYADNATQRGKQLQSSLDRFRGDNSFFTQPNINSSSGKAFTRYRDKLFARYNKGFEEYRKSDYFLDKAQTARETASNAQLENPRYLERRIAECKKEVKSRQKNLNRYEDAITAIENGEERRKYSGEIITVEELTSLINRELELTEKVMDKQAYLENCFEKVGGYQFSKENVKPGFIVDIQQWGKSEIMGTGPRFVTFKILEGGAQGSMLKAAYAEIKEIIKSEEKKAVVHPHPFEVGEKFTAVRREYPDDFWKPVTTEVIYEIISVTDKTIQLKPIDTDEKAITRKPFKSRDNNWGVKLNDTYGNIFYKQESPIVNHNQEKQTEKASLLGKLSDKKGDISKQSDIVNTDVKNKLER